MNPRKIKEDLGRIKTCVQRRDFPRALYLFCLSLKDLGGQAAPMELRGDFRNALSDICSDPVYKKDYPRAMSYTPGKEKELLIFFSKYYKQLQGSEDFEEYETALQRKLNLDRCLNDGKNFIAQGKPSEADDCFAEALKYYRDEIAAFGIMARAMMDASEYARAQAYLKKGLAERPDNADLRQLADECARLRAEARK